jgi:hypothetical protein
MLGQKNEECSTVYTRHYCTTLASQEARGMLLGLVQHHHHHPINVVGLGTEAACTSMCKHAMHFLLPVFGALRD